MAYTVAQIIDIAKISEFLARIDEQKGSLFGKRVAPFTAMILYMERKAVEYIYDLDPTDSTLTQTAWYLYSLCRGYNLRAANILNGGTGGSVSPIVPTPPALPSPYQFIVAASGNLINEGETTVTITDFIGYNLLFARGGIPQSTVATEPSYYSWNKTTGQFTVSPAAILGELFQIYAI